jgi:hypothetical protein
MGESLTHMRLVERLARWISDTYLGGSDRCLRVDLPSCIAGSRPPCIGPYVPDVYACEAAERGVIVGEAKTAQDLDSPHTHAQFAAFLEHCSLHPGSVLVIAVPWDCVRHAASILRSLRRRAGTEGVDTAVIERLSW